MSPFHPEAENLDHATTAVLIDTGGTIPTDELPALTANPPTPGTVTTLQHRTHRTAATHTRTAKKGTVTIVHPGDPDDVCLQAHDTLHAHNLPTTGWDNPTYASLVRLAHTRPDLRFHAGENGSTLAAIRDASPYQSTPASAAWRAHGFLTELRCSPTRPWGPAHAEPWDRAGFAPDAAARWRNEGIDPVAAGQWADAGFGYKTAAIWHHHGMTARSVAAGYRLARKNIKQTPRPDPALIAELWEPVQAMAVFAGERPLATDVVAQVLTVMAGEADGWTTAA